jgi:hypothetical protein
LAAAAVIRKKVIPPPLYYGPNTQPDHPISPHSSVWKGNGSQRYGWRFKDSRHIFLSLLPFRDVFCRIPPPIVKIHPSDFAVAGEVETAERFTFAPNHQLPGTAKAKPTPTFIPPLQEEQN